MLETDMVYDTGRAPIASVPLDPMTGLPAAIVVSRSVSANASSFRLSDGRTFEGRRYLPIGKGDSVAVNGDRIIVYVSRDQHWNDHTNAWAQVSKLALGGLDLIVKFKEIETAQEQALFDQLRQFHYRGGGGAGRTVPLIGTVDMPDLPRVVGFIELSSSMIANTARKRFFAGSYSEPSGVHWRDWDRETSREYSGLICRISRFVIHPELRGLGLASHFIDAARAYAKDRWHYGGYCPRFLEITADMLKFYPFVGGQFTLMGETEGNERRVSKDMSYLVKRAMSPEGIKAMPQGGGGIMSLQRAYAVTLLNYIKTTGTSLEDTVGRLQYDPALLDQECWEALHKLNRRPKPCYISGLTKSAQDFVSARATVINGAGRRRFNRPTSRAEKWNIDDLSIKASAEIMQTSEARLLQDAFGFVGSSVDSNILEDLSFSVSSGTITLVCGASGSGKSLLLGALQKVLTGIEPYDHSMVFAGRASRKARVGVLPLLDSHLCPLDYQKKSPLANFLAVTARCGLAEPQLLVRPIETLSSGQKYRLQLALAVLANPQILLIDNFCESLDRFSARAVCKGLSSLVHDYDMACVLATAAYDRLAEFLQPDYVLMLRRGDKAIYSEGALGEI